MNNSTHPPPDLGGDFPEIEFSFEDSMEAEILQMVIDALNRQGYPDLDRDSLQTDSAHREAALDMLRDCRPLPVVRQLIERIARGQL